MLSFNSIESAYILAALEVNGGNQTHTGAQLRIGAATLYRRLERYRKIGGRRSARKRG